MKTASAKAKGRRLQDWVVARILNYWPQLTSDDVKGAIMGESGEDVKMSTLAKKLLQIAIECKNRERLNVWAEYDHAKSHTVLENKNSQLHREPILIIKKNNKKPLVVVNADYFFWMHRQGMDLNDR